jgi:hypothetical protein
LQERELSSSSTNKAAAGTAWWLGQILAQQLAQQPYTSMHLRALHSNLYQTSALQESG